MPPHEGNPEEQAYAAAAVKALRGALRPIDRPAVLRVRGHCMAPQIRDSDMVHLWPVEERPTLGSVVIATDQTNELVCHRVIDWRTGGEVVICGDRSSICTTCKTEDLVGIVTAIERSGRTRVLQNSIERRMNRCIAKLHQHELRYRRSRSIVRNLLAFLCLGLRQSAFAANRLGWLVARRS